MNPKPDALIGRLFGGYQLLRVLGSGGAGTVYLGAKVDAPEQQVAIKVLTPPPQSASADLAEFKVRFEREAKALKLLQHPHILSLIAYGEDAESGLAYMVLPYMAGGTLSSRLTQGALPLEDAERYAAQIADALDYAHGRGIVHRDLKPGNVLLDENGEISLADFGIAKIFDAAGTTMVTITNTGQIMGTADYMSPEQAQGQEVTASSDIYSFGMLLYHLVTGQVAFEGKSLTQILLQIATTPPIPPRRLRPTLPAPAEAAILRALAKQPVDRFTTAGDLARAFTQGLRNEWAPGLRQAATVDAFVPRQTMAAPPVERIGSGRQARRRRWPLLIAVASMLVIIALTGTLLVTGDVFGTPGGPSTANTGSPTATATASSTTGSTAPAATKAATATATARQSGGGGGGGQPAPTKPAAQPTATPTTTPRHGNLAVNPTSLALGNYCGQSFSGATITLSNTGNGSLTWSQPGGSPYTLAPSSGQLSAGASSPPVSISGTKSNTTLSIAWLDGGQGATQTVNVSVSCVTPPPSNLTVNPTQVTINGACGPSATVNLGNTGVQTLVWSATTTNGATVGPTSGSIAGGQQETITISGIPSDPSQPGFVYITSNGGNGTITVDMSGCPF